MEKLETSKLGILSILLLTKRKAGNYHSLIQQTLAT